MTLTPGAKLGPYEILSPLGAGGMGEVYRARDPKLDRQVAIKVLPGHLAKDADAMARMEREAKALAALQHPNVLGIFDFGREDGVAFAVMELLEGATLREALRAGPLPRRQAVDVCQQIARGLAAAHGKGILHRDLKPENIFLLRDGHVKLLDFGLAKLMRPADPEGPTEALGSSPNTEKGVILGTVGYMSPEQVRGEVLDARSDLFSAGAVMFEILTGQRAFARSTAAETMTAILKEDLPEANAGATVFTGALRRVVEHCLEKDPERRFQGARDLAFALESTTGDSGAATGPVPAAGTRRLPAIRNILLFAALALMAGLAAWLGRRALLPGPPPASPVRFDLRAPAGTRFQWIRAENPFAISPEGTRIAFIARGPDDRDSLWVRSLADLAPVLLKGTEGASSPFWSPDGQSLAFFTEGKLKRLELSGGSPVTLCDAPFPYPTGSWGSRRTILFSGVTSQVISLVPESGGASRVVLKADSARGERFIRWPSFLPDGRHFLYLGSGDSEELTRLRVASTEDGATAPLLANCSRAQYVPAGAEAAGGTGFLLFARDGNLMAQPFDCGSLKLSGEAATTGQEVWQHVFIGTGRFSASANGVLASRGMECLTRLVWIDRSGNQAGSIASPARFEALRFAPDSRKLVLSQTDPRRGTRDILVGDVSRGVFTRLELGRDDYSSPVWSPDAGRLALSVGKVSQPPTLHTLALRGAGVPHPLVPSGGIHLPEDWSADGRFLLYFAARTESGSGLWFKEVAEAGKPVKYLSVPETSYGTSARFSPDGRWIAYSAPESGRGEIHLASFPDSGEQVRVSAGGGSRPRWRRDGRELYYVSANNEMVAVPVRLGPNPQIGAPRVLFRMNPAGWHDYDVTADGERFLVIENLPSQEPDAILLTLNWTALLRR